MFIRNLCAIICIIFLANNAIAAPKFKLVNSTMKLTAVKVAGDFRRPVGAYFPPNDDSKMFVIEQHTGKIFIQDLKRKQRIDQPFLEIDNLSTGNEQGLLGFAFHPQFQKNGKVYVNYTQSDGKTCIVEYHAKHNNKDQADPSSARLVLRIHQPQENHNGGWIGFGPEGYLYIAVGDGGGQWDSGTGHASKIGNGQDLTDNLLAKVLRIDINAKDAFKKDKFKNYGIPKSNPFKKRNGDPEIWAYGLRNVWRASFDIKTGDFYMGDVGQDKFEEINFISAKSRGGINFGWRSREAYEKPSDYIGRQKTRNMVDPIYAYGHKLGQPGHGVSVTGGYVYRGKNFPKLDGHYFFADYVSKGIWSFKYNPKKKYARTITDWTDAIRRTDGQQINNPSSFAQDSKGEIYIVDHSWNVYKIMPYQNN